MPRVSAHKRDFVFKPALLFEDDVRGKDSEVVRHENADTVRDGERQIFPHRPAKIGPRLIRVFRPTVA